MVFFADVIQFVTRLSTDTLLLVFLIAGLSFTAIYLGKDWVIALIFSLFAANWFFTLIPFDLPTSAWYVFGTKVIIALVLASILKRFLKSEFPYRNSKKYIQAVILGLTATITLMAAGLVGAHQFSSLISRWFEGSFLFWSSLVPLIVLLFVIRK